MFISNNRAAFHLCLKKNLVKHEKVLKYYEIIVCNFFFFFFLLFMSLLTAKFVKNSHI